MKLLNLLFIFSYILVSYIQIVLCFNIINYESDILNNYTSKHCKIKHGHFKCTIVGKALEDGIVEARNYIDLNIMDKDLTTCDFLTDEINNEDEQSWCLTIASLNLKFMFGHNGSQDYDFVYPDYFTNIFLSSSKLEMKLNYQNLSSAHGFVKLPKHCNITRLDTNCSKNFTLRLKSIVPKQENMNNNKMLVNFIFIDKAPSITHLLYVSDSNNDNLKSILKYILKIENLKISGPDNYNISIEQVFFNDDLKNISEFNSLSTLSFIQCALHDIPEDIIATTDKFRKLTILDLAHNDFTKVPNGIRFLINLEELVLSQQHANYFNMNVSIDHLKRLKSLDVSANKLNFSITRLTLPKLPSLQKLFLNNCSIQTVSEDAFINFSKIKYLDLDWNNIHVLYPNTFLYTSINSRIVLSNNKLGNNLKLNIKSIRELNLATHLITDPNNILNIGKIGVLLLNHNQIISWTSEDIFVSKNYKITALSITNNLIRTITSEMGKSLTKMRKIIIHDNPYNCNLCSLNEFQVWLNNSNNIVHTFKHISKPNKKIYCKLPQEEANVLILKAKLSNPELCILPNYYIKYGIPSFVIILIISITSLILFAHRTKILFLYHISKLRNLNSTKELEENFDFDVFVSYSSKDRSWVIDTLVPALETPQDGAQKYNLCLHERDFPLGAYIMDNVVACIEKSRRVILILSPNFIQSQWCQWELHLAQHKLFEQNRPNFLVLIEKENIDRSSLPLHLRTLIRTRTYFEWPQLEPVIEDMIVEFWTKLRLALGTPLSGKPEEEKEDEMECDEDFEFKL